MSDCIALLRAVNVGGHGTVPMAQLRTELARQGFVEVRTLIQSGNLVFRSPGTPGPELEARLEHAIDRKFGVRTDAFVRTSAEWTEIVRRNPFPKEAATDPARLMLVCLKEAPVPAALSALRDAIRGREVVERVGRHLYAVYPDGMGSSKFTMTVVESRLGTRATARNWNTVSKLAAMARA